LRPEPAARAPNLGAALLRVALGGSNPQVLG